jgi:hypothetical protein
VPGEQEFDGAFVGVFVGCLVGVLVGRVAQTEKLSRGSLAQYPDLHRSGDTHCSPFSLRVVTLFVGVFVGRVVLTGALVGVLLGRGVLVETGSLQQFGFAY